ncbi:MAG: serine hydrolase [Sandaracinobacter sp.]
MRWPCRGGAWTRTPCRSRHPRPPARRPGWRPMAVETKFRMASYSKMLTAIAIMQLRKQGKLRLDDPVVQHLPWFQAKPAGRCAHLPAVAPGGHFGDMVVEHPVGEALADFGEGRLYAGLGGGGGGLRRGARAASVRAIARVRVRMAVTLNRPPCGESGDRAPGDRAKGH